jgi:hypothetical protein
VVTRQTAPQGQHRGIFEVYIPPVDFCQSCRRDFLPHEKSVTYNHVDLCAGCAGLQRIGDLRDEVEDLTRRLRGTPS